MKKEFFRISEDMESVSIKNSAVSRHKAREAEEASHFLLATQKCYRHLALDYVLQINCFQSSQKLQILNSMMSYYHMQYAFYHQGYDLLKDLEPIMKKLSTQLDQMTLDSVSKRKEMEQQCLLLQQKDSSVDSEIELLSNPLNDIPIEGYLFKRSSKKIKMWKRRWFSVHNNQLIYQKSIKEEPTVMVEDLRLCAVRCLEEIERRFCFEVVSVHKNYLLQADSGPLRDAWVRTIQTSIDTAYREKSGTKSPESLGKSSSSASLVSDSPKQSQKSTTCTSSVSILTLVQRVAGNEKCCDCGKQDPRWASINLGILLCIECSGIHRSLGVHLSKVRSLTLDSWEPEVLKLLCALGNNAVNQIYEARCSEVGATKPTSDSLRSEKESWIKMKYVERRFLRKLTIPLPAVDSTGGIPVTNEDQSAGEASSPQNESSLILYHAARAGNLTTMAEALAHKADVNWINRAEERRTPLMNAAVGGSLLACEFLLQNGAGINYRDVRGRGALHLAAHLGHTGQVCLFMKRGANQYAVDEMGHDPLSIAVEIASADIVTLLRMARMNEEMRDSEGFFGHMGDDETFQDIFRDFSDMASNDPEKLSRRRADSPLPESDEAM
ncbi:arf-GAP with coiled-coil, ANK repeat and PH domain-containing protein 2-like [Protopterus annectens]|uniref:arf-GAP with coiled-coil, ANK repeat and PH domain-containing protein 2-like n=1 Tax=Protopterus annectens TaxID=7888 RepID=UPI001CF93196|nr:arf-GAP with coiled-coil, ANK repeat and PH domain-containing protein 2-like [Protopterus annectens]